MFNLNVALNTANNTSCSFPHGGLDSILSTAL